MIKDEFVFKRSSSIANIENDISRRLDLSSVPNDIEKVDNVFDSLIPFLFQCGLDQEIVVNKLVDIVKDILPNEKNNENTDFSENVENLDKLRDFMNYFKESSDVEEWKEVYRRWLIHN